ncbi:cohesin subunit SA-2 [Drosophila montana]|uniref:cohesin subunit SA-2 n=1 Tax=Drosophila montana TaxID=40370 RepID=UPI00313F03FA
MSSISTEVEVQSSLPDTEAESMEFQLSNDEGGSNKENEEPLELMQEYAQETCSSLLELVCDRRQKTKDICQAWIRLYTYSPEAALLKFMQFVLEASGSQYQLPDRLEIPFDFSDMLIAATAHFGNKSLSYPLIMKSGNSFARDVCYFVQYLMRLLHTTSLILDDVLLRNVAGFVMVCADSKVRAFRHTCTLIGLKMMTTLCATVLLESEQLKEIWLQMFTGVFLERSGDVVDEIRYLCLAECGIWLEKYPQCYLNPDHVKHLFQPLQDNSRKVIECCFQALFKLWHNPKLRPVCLEQGAKYRMTLLGLTMSAESELGQMAIQLLGLFYRANPLFLDESMLQVIEQLVFAAHRGLAQAAADLVPYRYQETASTEQERLLILVQFFVRFGEHEHAAYLVDAFYGRNDIVLAWSSMVSMLLQPDTLTEPETSAIIEILTRAVKQAVTGEIPPGRYTEDLVRQAQPNAKKLATRYLLSKLPALLRQYRSSERDLSNLLELPQFVIMPQKAQFQELLEQIKDIMFEQEALSVLQMGAMTLEHLYGLNASCLNHRKELLNNAVTNYMIATAAWEQSLAGTSRLSVKNNAKRLLDTLRLLSTLYARFDLNDWQLSDKILDTLKHALDERESRLPDESLSLYLTIVYVSLSWDLQRSKDAAKAGRDVAEECRALRRRMESFLLVNFQLIEHTSIIQVGCDAFSFTCDIFVLFADPLRQNSCDSIRALEYKSKISEYQLIESFVLRFAFAAAEDEGAAALLAPEMFSLLQSKRRVLASYCKLVFHNVMPVMRSCIVLQYYERYNPVFGDILRATLERCLSVNPVNCGMTVMHTCLLVYKRIRFAYPNAVEAAASTDFADLLKLANLLAELFNAKQLEIRSGVVILHRAGIRYAAEIMPDDPTSPPENLLYLSVLQQFVPQLLAQDMLDVLKFVQFIDQVALPTSRADEWQPLVAYRNALEIALVQSCRRDDLSNLPSYAVE